MFSSESEGDIKAGSQAQHRHHVVALKNTKQGKHRGLMKPKLSYRIGCYGLRNMNADKPASGPGAMIAISN